MVGLAEVIIGAKQVGLILLVVGLVLTVIGGLVIWWKRRH